MCLCELNADVHAWNINVCVTRAKKYKKARRTLRNRCAIFPAPPHPPHPPHVNPVQGSASLHTTKTTKKTSGTQQRRLQLYTIPQLYITIHHLHNCMSCFCRYVLQYIYIYIICRDYTLDICLWSSWLTDVYTCIVFGHLHKQTCCVIVEGCLT